jgi:putative ABC transport system permease protein
VSPGFDLEHIVKAEVSLPRFQYAGEAQWTAFDDELLRRLRAEPGLDQTAIAVPIPIANGFVNLAFDIAGRPALSAAASRTADYESVSPNYFHVMGISLVRGRVFTDDDVASAPAVTVISSTLARSYFPDEDPIGRRLVFGLPPGGTTAREIVGIVGDVRDVQLGDPAKPMMYVPYAQASFPGAGLVVRSGLTVANIAAAIRHDVAAIDKDLPVTGVATMPEVVEESVAQPRFRALLLALFAALALVTAATGIFGVMSYSVSCRTHEIGIRRALGASAGAIRWMVSRDTLVLTLAGLAVGIPGALAASRLIASMLFGVSAHDPATLAGVAAGLVAVAALASYVPGRRAVRVDPMIALRHD